MTYISNYFSNDPIYVRLIDKNAPLKDWIDIQNDIVKKQLEEASGRLVNLNQQIQEQNKNARKTKIWFGLISVFLVGILSVSIVGLFL